ncbi:hypothetical protein MMC25_006861 [Agyrium rufum]|nr:hypothetical protein [Agyrium rufum]
MASQADHDALITEFCGMTGSSAEEAQQYLISSHWNLGTAAAEYYAQDDTATSEEQQIPAAPPAASSQTPAYTPQAAVPGGGRRLGSDDEPGTVPGAFPSGSDAPPANAPPSYPSTQKSKRANPGRKIATLGDLGSGGPGGNDESDDDDDADQDFFAGGEKSALAVQNPDELKRRIIEKAKKGVPRSTPSANTPQAPSHFSGPAQTLGGDDAPSVRVGDDPQTSTPTSQAPQIHHRELHFWKDGFSVDDGPLYRSDDPANAGHLAMIRAGRAPLAIMNVQRGEEVDVKLIQHEENYVQPKKKYKPFSGHGNRLGSPVPGAIEAEDMPVPKPATSQGSTSSTVATSQAGSSGMQVDDSQPTVTLQVRLGDGSRLSSRFNTSHTIGDVYDFVAASSPGSQGRAWVLMTTFPSKELKDKGATLESLSDFKRGGVVVQKWT